MPTATLVRRVRLALLVAVAVACGSACAAPLQTMSIVNQTDRAIEAIYVYPTGASDHGASRGKLAPSASTQLQVKPGHVDVYALSAKVKLDEHNRDQPSASQSIELAGPVKVVFYDVTAKPPGLDRPGVIGIAFQVRAPTPAPASSEPAPAP